MQSTTSSAAKKRLAIMVVTSVWLGACGGGGGNGDAATSAPATASGGGQTSGAAPAAQGGSAPTSVTPSATAPAPVAEASGGTSAGAPATGTQARQFQVTSATTGQRTFPNVIPLSGGGYLIAWTDAPDYPLLSTQGVYMQRYAADGTAVGGRVRIDDGVQVPAQNAQAAALSDGGFVIGYSVHDSFADSEFMTLARYSATGARTFLTHVPGSPVPRLSLAGLPNGGYAWVRPGPSTSYVLDIFDANNQQVRDAITLNQYAVVAPTLFATTDSILHVVTTIDNDGLVGSNVYEQRFTPAGAALGNPELRIATDTQTADVSAAVLGDDKYVIAWTQRVTGNEPRVANREYQFATAATAQMFRSDGAKIGGEVRPDAEIGATPGACLTSVRDTVPCPTPLQRAPQVMPLQGGSYVLAWATSNRTGVQGARFGMDGAQASSPLQLTDTAADAFAVTPTASTTPVLTWTPARGTGANVVAKQWAASGPQ